MSWDRFGWINAIYVSDLGPYAKAVAGYLVTKADTVGECWPSIDTIAAAVSRSRNNTKGALAELEGCGWIVRRARTRRTYVYILRTPEPGIGHTVTGHTVTGHTVPDSGSHREGHTVTPLGHTVTPLGHTVTDPRSHRDPDQTREQTREQTNAATRAISPPDSEQQPADDPDQVDDDVRLWGVCHDVGLFSSTPEQCRHLIEVANRAGIPDAVEYLAERIRDIRGRTQVGAGRVVRWIVADIEDGKWKPWAAKRRAMLIGEAGRIHVEVTHDDRTADQVAAAAGSDLVAAWVEYFRRVNAGNLELSAKFDGFDDVDAWLEDAAIEALRESNQWPPGVS